MHETKVKENRHEESHPALVEKNEGDSRVDIPLILICCALTCMIVALWAVGSEHYIVAVVLTSITGLSMYGAWECEE